MRCCAPRMQAPPSRLSRTGSRMLLRHVNWHSLAVPGCCWPAPKEAMPQIWGHQHRHQPLHHHHLHLHLRRRRHLQSLQPRRHRGHQPLRQERHRDLVQHLTRALLRRAKAKDGQQFITTILTKIRMCVALSKSPQLTYAGKMRKVVATAQLVRCGGCRRAGSNAPSASTQRGDYKDAKHT